MASGRRRVSCIRAPVVDFEAIAQRLWRGLPLMWQEEQRIFEVYEPLVGQELTEEGFELWLTRVQVRRCPVAGTGCDAPRHGRFCERHRAQNEARGLLGV